MKNYILMVALLFVFTFAKSKSIKETLAQYLDSNTTITAIAENEDFIWVGTNNGLYKIYKRKNRIIFMNKSNSLLPADFITSICCGDHGHVWIGTNNGIMHYDRFTYTLLNKENSGIPDNRISSLAIDNDKNLWIGTLFNGLVKTDGYNYKIYNTSNSLITSNTIFSVSIDRSGDVWVGLLLGGLTKIHNGIMENFPTGENGLSASNINFVKQNEDGKYFIATYNEGIFEFDGKQFQKKICAVSNVKNIINVFLNHKNNKLIFCCENGLFTCCAITFQTDKKLNTSTDQANYIEQLCLAK